MMGSVVPTRRSESANRSVSRIVFTYDFHGLILYQAFTKFGVWSCTMSTVAPAPPAAREERGAPSAANSPSLSAPQSALAVHGGNLVVGRGSKPREAHSHVPAVVRGWQPTPERAGTATISASAIRSAGGGRRRGGRPL